MTKTKPVDIRLREANARFTKAKAAVDGTPGRESAYQKAKKQLALVRQEHAEQRHVPSRPGDAQVKIEAVAATAGTKQTRRTR